MRTRLVTAAAVIGAALVAPQVGLVTPAVAAGGNNGTIKVAEVDQAGTESNDPHVGCTFAIEWYNFDAKATSTVTFEAQAPTKDAAPKVVAGATKVVLEDDAAKGGTDFDGRQVYTLSFSGEPQAQQGYHVKVTATTTGSKGNDTKTKTFWAGPCEKPGTTDPGTTDPGTTDPGTTDPGTTDPGTTDPGTTDPGTTDPGTTDPGTTDPGTTDPGTTDPGTTDPGTTDPGTTDPGTTDPGTTDPGTTDPEPSTPFDWNWTYPAPTCSALTVSYPSNIPSGQANDVNIRVETNKGQVSMNFHHNTGTWSGTRTFTFADSPSWRADASSYKVTWVQVGGTNYHWQGSVACETDGLAATDDLPQAVTTLAGYRAGAVVLRRGGSLAADAVSVRGADAGLVLERRTTTGWTLGKTVATNAKGQGSVVYPRFTRKGVYQYRLTVSGSIDTTGATSQVLTVRVR